MKSVLRKIYSLSIPLLVGVAATWPLQASAFTMFGNSATQGPDLVHEFDVQGMTATLVKNYTVSTGNGRGVVVVGNIIYSTESGPSGNIFGGSNIIYKTDRTTGASLGTIVVSALPAGAAMSTLAWDGSHFWTTEYLGGNHAYQIDTNGNITKTIVLSLASNNMDGLEFFNGKLICNRADAVGPYDIYDLDGNVLQAAFIAKSSSTTGIAFDGTNFFTSNLSSSSISVWDGTTGAFLFDITLSGGSFNIEDLSVDYATRPDTGGGGGCSEGGNCEVAGKGTVETSGGSASLGMKVQTLRRGHHDLSFSDPSAGITFSTRKATGITISATHAEFSGVAKVGRRKFSFTVTVDDTSGIGTPDHFHLTLSNGYTADGPLTSGDLSIHDTAPPS